MFAEGRIDVGVPEEFVVHLRGEVVSRALRWLEQLQRTDMHRLFPGFGEQEDGIDRRNEFHDESPPDDMVERSSFGSTTLSAGPRSHEAAATRQTYPDGVDRVR
ncbi:hypothetical protein IFM12276_62700 [Nocardia sputorum]|uniref:Uncharacterized protein n=1 Tax=Nocardia sputorum TaxID=2984338 RepID=A0ABN6UD72_9NOCA|nr:hypothetical protein IFM12276_62700 [Nocardia sputorum]